MTPLTSDPDARIGPCHLFSAASTSDDDSDMRISNDDEAVTSRMDVDVDEPDIESEDEQVEVDVLPDAGSESEPSEVEVGEPEVEAEDYELEEEDDEIQESRSPSVVAPTSKSPLKIKFKVRPGAVTRGRRTRAAAIQVESEDSDESEEEEMPQNVRLTKRQAALAKARKGIAGSETSVDEEPEEEAAPPPPAKRRRGANSQVDPSELALRKEESARKRRNVSERKLQNEKAETINRLLKKQSRPRNKRTTALSTAPPAEIPTPPIETPGSGDENAAVALEDTVDLADAQFLLIPQETDPEPIMYRWISTSRAPDDADTVTDGDQPKVMRVSFAVPPSVLPPPSNSESEVMASDDGRTQVTAPAPLPAVCGVEGCTAGRRYRLVGGPWGTGACGMAHLKLLQAAS